MDEINYYPTYKPTCRYDSIFTPPINVSDLYVKFKYIDSDYKTYLNSDSSFGFIDFKKVSVIKNIASFSLLSICGLGLAIINGVRAPIVGTELSKMYFYVAFRALEGLSGNVIGLFNPTLGSYLWGDADAHFNIYVKIYKHRLADLELNIFQ